MQIKESIKIKYDRQYYDDIDDWRLTGAKQKAQNIIDLSEFIQFQDVLDVGSGEGSVLYWLDQKGFSKHITALEISESGAQKIKSRHLPSVQAVELYDGYHIPFPDHTFDLAICSHVIEHVECPRLLIREIARVSKYQILEIPIDFSFQVDKKTEHFLSYGHINIYTPQTFRFLLKTEGLTVIKYLNRMYSRELFRLMNKDQSFTEKLKSQLKLLL